MLRHLREGTNDGQEEHNATPFAADKRPISEAEVRQFLVDSGFTPDGDGWVAEEKDLGQLDPSEVMQVKRLG